MEIFELSVLILLGIGCLGGLIVCGMFVLYLILSFRRQL